jgi:hypothetical protein
MRYLSKECFTGYTAPRVNDFIHSFPGRDERLKNAFQTGERMKMRSARVQNAFSHGRPFGTRFPTFVRLERVRKRSYLPRRGCIDE